MVDGDVLGDTVGSHRPVTGVRVDAIQPAEETGDGARGMVEGGLGELIPTSTWLWPST
jgi:metal-dependent amidase/aminoacylase/carboxypeptidase family protein